MTQYCYVPKLAFVAPQPLHKTKQSNTRTFKLSLKWNHIDPKKEDIKLKIMRIFHDLPKKKEQQKSKKIN